ncbi:MAG: AAA family ATPase [Gaiellales bacterium]
MSTRPPLSEIVTRLAVGELTWADLVVPEEVRSALEALSRRVADGGLVAVVAGPPGVGKTFATRVWAESLRLELWQVDCTRLLTRHGDTATTRGLDEVCGFGERPPGVLLLDRPGPLVARDPAAFLERLRRRRGPSVLELDAPDSAPAGLPAVILTRPDREQRCRHWQALVERVSPLSAPDYERLADLELVGARIDAAVSAVVLAHGDERLETEALIRAAAAPG